MNRGVLFFVLMLFVLPSVFADSSDLNSGEAVGDSFSGSLKAGLCNVPMFKYSFCLFSLDDTTSGSVDDEDIASLLAQENANKELSEAEIVEMKSETATARLVALFDLFGAFWVLLFELISALFIFFEVYLLLWILFVGIPKFLNLIIEIIAKNRGLR